MTHSEDNSPFASHNRKEIAFILAGLAKHFTPIKLETLDGTRLQTVVLDVSAEDNYVYLDAGPDSRINDKIIRSKGVNFSSQTSIEVRWNTTHLRLMSLPDGDVFSMAFPAFVERIQRREYFRLSTPKGGNALICRIPVAADVVEGVLLDMSAGGIGVSIKGALPESLSQGAQLQGCSIKFPASGVVPVEMKICRVMAVVTNNGEETHHVGIELVNLSRGASNVVQRQMIELEKEQLSKH